MKKIRKSLVILPALATMALTTVASVTGTVAWFTASRAVTVTGSKFETVAETSNLKCTLTAGQGTTKGSETSVTVDGLMTHGSYDAKATADGSLYVAYMDSDAAISGYSNKGTATVTSGADNGQTNSSTWKSATKSNSKDVWYGVTWSLQFTYEGAQGADSSKNYLLYDINGTTWTDSVTGGETLKGLRIAFMTGSKLLVVGGREGTNSTEIKHVQNGDTTSATGKFTVGTDYAVYSDSTEKLADGATTLSSSMFSLGEISATQSITITCVAWFEGEDAAIVDSTTVMSSINATLPFYVRNSVAQ